MPSSENETNTKYIASVIGPEFETMGLDRPLESIWKWQEDSTPKTVGLKTQRAIEAVLAATLHQGVSLEDIQSRLLADTDNVLLHTTVKLWGNTGACSASTLQKAKEQLLKMIDPDPELF